MVREVAWGHPELLGHVGGVVVLAPADDLTVVVELEDTTDPDDDLAAIRAERDAVDALGEDEAWVGGEREDLAAALGVELLLPLELGADGGASDDTSAKGDERHVPRFGREERLGQCGEVGLGRVQGLEEGADRELVRVVHLSHQVR